MGWCVGEGVVLDVCAVTGRVAVCGVVRGGLVDGGVVVSLPWSPPNTVP